MRSKIGKKIFFITFIALIILVSLILIFQKHFFEKFYINEKNNSLIKSVEEFRNSNSAVEYNQGVELYKRALLPAMNKFETNNNAKVGVVTPKDSLIYIATNEYTESSFKQIYNNLYLPNSQYISSGKIFVTISDNSSFDPTITVVICKLNDGSILMAVSSVEPIREATSVLNRFLPYFIVGTLMVALFYSMILSKYIGDPLIKLNKIAKKMSNMDFSERYTPLEDDEINNLGTTLNFLSENLESALTELKSKNDILQEEVEHERKIEEMRKGFIADVSHELKTPIGIIEGYAEGIRDGIVQGEAKNDYLNIIIDEAHKMNKLVMDMLELSKLQSGNVKPNIETFNIIRMIQGSLRKYNVLIREKSLEVVFNPEFEYLYVEGDTFQIEQVLSNFMTNAIKYTPSREKIVISIEKLESKVLISIENLGAQISKDELDNIWNKFYKIDKSRVRDKNSSGLGLSITKGILDLHNSSYGIQNTSNGVLSYFTLNLSTDEKLE
ncbi:sensor histidine kinase [Clostridium intestinale]|jgi:signal transduction histidine kinase|uniref:histidine kinase n=1 Tax=Clostridium intestinale URNW TaxID=1294142 RepID=U2N3Z1_9CLOT|nr:HAMP domain-containing sensor histidine kinase [Clostridium intestinale]ERK30217.1 integral membrane sensor signal transduction histidine kinase [Clostridium intestinale URNW]